MKNAGKQLWVVAMETYARKHKDRELTAMELAVRTQEKCPRQVLRKAQERAMGKLAAELLANRKDRTGVRLNGCYHSGDNRWIWKPFDAMNATQIRAAFDNLVRSSLADIRSLVATEEKCNQLLTSRNAEPLNESWRSVMKAILDGEEEQSEGLTG